MDSDLRKVQQPSLVNIVLYPALPQSRLINLSTTKIELTMHIYYIKSGSRITECRLYLRCSDQTVEFAMMYVY